MPFKGRRLSFEDPLPQTTHHTTHSGAHSRNEDENEKTKDDEGGLAVGQPCSGSEHGFPCRYNKYGAGFSYQSQGRGAFAYRRSAPPPLVLCSLVLTLSFIQPRPVPFGGPIERLYVVPAAEALSFFFPIDKSFFLLRLTTSWFAAIQLRHGLLFGPTGPEVPTFLQAV